MSISSWAVGDRPSPLGFLSHVAGGLWLVQGAGGLFCFVDVLGRSVDNDMSKNDRWDKNDKKNKNNLSNKQNNLDEKEMNSRIMIVTIMTSEQPEC